MQQELILVWVLVLLVLVLLQQRLTNTIIMLFSGAFKVLIV